jgi:hypothetical protein
VNNENVYLYVIAKLDKARKLLYFCVFCVCVCVCVCMCVCVRERERVREKKERRKKEKENSVSVFSLSVGLAFHAMMQKRHVRSSCIIRQKK